MGRACQGFREIAYYSQRSRLIRYLVLFFSLDVIWTLLLIGFLFVASGSPFVQPSPEPVLMMVTQLCTLLLSIPILFGTVWISSFMFFTIRRFVSHKPALLITSEGISIQDVPVTASTFISWSDIASLFEYRRRSNTYLCLDPKEKIQFLSHYHWIWRFFVCLGAQNTGTLIKVPDWFLSEPVGEVLSQIQEMFQDEIHAHRIVTFRPPLARM